MKKNFKKLLSVVLATLMLCSIFSVCVLAAGPYTITVAGGTRYVNGIRHYAVFDDRFDSYDGAEKVVTSSDNIFAYSSSGAKSKLKTNDIYYEFTYTHTDGVVYTFTYTINEDTGERENCSITFETDTAGYFVFPEIFFEMPHHDIKDYSGKNRWCTSPTSTSNSGATAKTEVGYELKVTGDKYYYGTYEAIKYDVVYNAGVDGSGTVAPQTGNTYGKKITVSSSVFTRSGYVQIGWALTESADEIEYELGQKQVPVYGNMVLYPVWQKVDYNVKYDVESMNFGAICEGYGAIASQKVTVTNKGNTDVTLAALSNPNYTIKTTGALKIPANGGTLVVEVQPKTNLPVGSYTTDLVFDFGVEDVNFAVNLRFVVRDHLFVKYAYNNDATYSQDGTETAPCHFGCGAEDDRVAADTMKEYSIDNNTADGLLKEYLYHKTVNFVAYGSGMDDYDGDIGKRFRPVSWYVNDTFNGEFAADATDYTVKYVHDDFGSYVLTIKYVEEEFVDGAWSATGVEDEKSFDYSIGPSDKDKENIVRPQTITSIIFALMGYLVDLLGGLLG